MYIKKGLNICEPS